MNTGGLVAPADVQTIDEGAIAKSIHGSQSSAPTWGVGDPVATALSGLSDMVDKYAKAYDDVVVNDYTMQKSKELDELYNNPDTGVFNTRKGDAAKGAYQDYKATIRDMWDHDAMDKLTDRQRGMASRHLRTLFSSYGHRVAEFETKQLMGAQTERCKNTVQNAIDLMGTGRATDDDIANAMNAIRMAYENMGQMHGWDAETIARMQNDATSDGFTKASAALATFDPIAAYGLLQANQAFMTPAAHAGAVQALEGKLNSVYQEEYIRRLEAGDKEGAERWLAQHSAVGGGVSLGNRVAQFESGGEGVRAIGYDGNGGTSYGKFQLSSKQGSYQEWLDYLAKQGPEGAAIAGRLRGAGPLNTGSRKGAAVDAYKKEAQANPELFERTQREYINKNHYGPMLSRLPVDERAMIERNAGLQEMAWSIAVQHGGGGGAKLLRRAWKPGMNEGQLVDAVYGIRGGYFGSSTKEVRDAVQSRFGDERRLIHSMLQQPQGPAGEYRPVPGALKPSQIIALQSRGKTMIDKIHVDNAYEVLLGMDRNEAKQQLMTVEGQQKLGLDAEQAAILWRKITPYWNTVAKQEMDKGVGDVIKTVRDLPLANRDAKAVELLEKQFTDETEYANALAEYAKRMKREDKMQVAASWSKLKPVIEEGVRNNKSYAQIWQEVKEDDSGRFSDYDKQAIDNIRKIPKEDEKSRDAMGKLLVQGNAMLQEGHDPKDVMTWFEGAAFGELTQSQIKKGLGYFEKNGNIGGVSLARCDNLYRRLLGAKGKNSKGVHMPERGYALIVDNLDPKVTHYTDEQLAELISSLMIQEFGNYNWLWNTSTTIFDALDKGILDDLMETDPEKINKVKEDFKASQGYYPTDSDAARMAMERPYRKFKFDGVRTTNASK